LKRYRYDADCFAVAAPLLRRGGRVAIHDPGLAAELVASLEEKGIGVRVFSGFSGEPKLKHLREAAHAGKGAYMVVGIGGGSALDIAKITACCAASGEDPMFYALAEHALPAKPLKTILIPTTAGTGSEVTVTSIFAGEDGRKLWIWGPESRADLVILDPDLTLSLPPQLTAWCGMDAFVHAFEACTNRRAHQGVFLHAHEALRLVSGSLPRAIEASGDLDARGKLLLGSTYAGIAINSCGTAIAHNISHALAGLAPIHHGLATALAFEATLPWLVEADTPFLREAALALGLEGSAELPAFVSGLMDRCGIVRSLPAAFASFTAAELAREMQAPENRPMRDATARDMTEADIGVLAEKIMSLAS
jgi:alcohol dehydrogenase